MTTDSLPSMTSPSTKPDMPILGWWRKPILLMCIVLVLGGGLTLHWTRIYHQHVQVLQIDTTLLRKLNLMALSLSRYQYTLAVPVQGYLNVGSDKHLQEAKRLFGDINTLLLDHNELVGIDNLLKVSDKTKFYLHQLRSDNTLADNSSQLLTINQFIDQLLVNLRSDADNRQRLTDDCYGSILITALSTLLLLIVLIVRVLWLYHSWGTSSALKRRTQDYRNLFEHWQQLLNSMPSGCMIVDLEQHVLRVNTNLLRLLGARENQLIGQAFWQSILPELPDNSREYTITKMMARRQSNEKTQQQQTRFCRCNGELFWSRWSDTQLLNADGSLVGYLIMIDDISEQVTQQQELHRLTQDLYRFQHQERSRIAQLLHDEVAQQLSALRLTLDATRMRARQRSDLQEQLEQFASALPETQQVIDELLAKVRNWLTVLRPPLLDECGVGKAISHEAERLRNTTTAKLDVDLHEVENWRTRNEIEHACFYILREALFNAIKHSGAHAIAMRATRHDNTIRFAVIDDGVGVDRSHLQKAGHLGVVGMKERAQLFGAELNWLNPENGGTIVTLTLEALDTKGGSS